MSLTANQDAWRRQDCTILKTDAGVDGVFLKSIGAQSDAAICPVF